LLGGILLTLILIGACFHRQIYGALAVRLLLNSSCPREDILDELLRASDDPVPLLKRCWTTGKVVHRELVMAFLTDHVLTNPPPYVRAEPLVFAGATDGDASVRELALAAMESTHSPRLPEFAEAQLDNLDPELRLLGLGYLRKADPQQAVPVTMRLLDDSDLRVVAGAELALMRWSGEDFGVRSRLALAPQEAYRPGRPSPSNAEMIRRGVEQRKAWWTHHAKDYPQGSPGAGGTAPTEPMRPRMPEFKLTDLHGKAVRLAQFRGKVVLLNFWATWCPACQAEIPELIALQDKLGNQIAILGAALDGVVDEHGHTPGEDEVDKSERPDHSLSKVRAKIDRVAKARGINYTILWDPKGSVGGQFNGGELPTNVIIDPEGRLQRRFIGERRLAVLEAMVAEASNSPIRNHSPPIAQRD
jgi:thiol-disulfide isomerase/thioredoxin